MNPWDTFYGPNAGYALDLYERYLHDPQSVDPQTRAYFDALRAAGIRAAPDASLGLNGRATGNGQAPAPPAAPVAVPVEDVSLVVRAARLARGIREYGYLAAHVDPLGTPGPGDPMIEPETHHLTEAELAALPATIVWPSAGPEVGSCLEAIRRLRAIYTGAVGYEFAHVQSYEERQWLHDTVESRAYQTPLSPEEKRALLYRLIEVETFEHFLHTTFVGQRRFSVEGNDMLIPMLDDLIRRTAAAGTREVVMGMAHRGRLNVLAHVLGKPYSAIFSEFHHAPDKDMVPSEGSRGINHGWTGDVKYHLGASRTLHEGPTVQVQITLAHNPSHLEFVNPVVQGFARAAQEDRTHPGQPTQNTDAALAIAMHGDAAFTGEGVVAETLNMSRLAGYETGGTVHIIVNNQIGFTTEAADQRSTLYASDPARGYEIPIVHVNADDPEACLSVIALAFAYRQRFRKDFLIDLVGYRRWGHNEGDEPSFTQPLLYEQIAHHPTVRALYAEQLEQAGVVTPQDVAAMEAQVRSHLESARDAMPPQLEEPVETAEPTLLEYVETGVPEELLRAINQELLQRPADFAPHNRLDRLLQRRNEALDSESGIDWGHAETLAFGSILADGTAIRLTGQDAERGTFSQRHLVLHDIRTGGVYIPLQHLPQAKASFAVYNSPLTETAVLAFEYGYSVHAPEAMVLWEAQFGDFANTAQVIIDQFIVAARAKWRQQPSVVMLLPHGYEGQGPEHSSARLERYLQLAAEENLLIAYPSSAAQYFHLLRLHARNLTVRRRPLIIMTPKSLLRNRLAAASLQQLVCGSFRPVWQEWRPERPAAVERLVLCTGKVAVDMESALRDRGERPDWLALARVEQLFPFPVEEVSALIRQFANLTEVVWVQEEPRNMGAWTYIAPHLRQTLPESLSLQYVGRPERAATAEGLPEVHASEQQRIVETALRAPALAR